MDVSDVKVTDEDGLLSRSMMIKAKNIIMKERIWINRVISEKVTPVGKVTQMLNQLLVKVQIRIDWKTFPLCGPIQGVQDCTCGCPRSQAGTGKNTHIEIREVGGLWCKPLISSWGFVYRETV